MSPPIFNPDGSEVSEIVLPDGSTASQVIGPDGNVVFEAGPDIPDSVASYSLSGDTANKNITAGFAFTIDSDYGKMGYRIGAGTAGFTRAILYEWENISTNTSLQNQVATKNISNLTNQDSFTITHNYDADIKYTIAIDANGSSYDYGFLNLSGTELPYTSPNVDITDPYRDQNGIQADDTFIYNLNAVGDPKDL